MLGYSRDGTGIGMEYLPMRAKPCLVVKKGNSLTKVASFNNEESVIMFIDALAEMFNLPKIDWTEEDMPVKIQKAAEWWANNK